jgi:hypothetical protein
MADLQGFLKQASETIGLSDDSTKTATGALLNLVGEKAGKDDLNELVGKIPGAESLLSETKGSGSGGMLGGLGKAVSGALGGKLGGAASVLGAFKSSGLDMEQSTKLVTMFFGFAKTQAGGDVVGRILNKIPELKKLLG